MVAVEPNVFLKNGAQKVALNETVYNGDGEYLGHFDGQEWKRVRTRPDLNTMQTAEMR